MKRHHPKVHERTNSSSDDEDEDPFSKLRHNSARLKQSSSGDADEKTKPSTTMPSSLTSSSSTAANNVSLTENHPVQLDLPSSVTSSMKRHHGCISDSRKSKLDSMLQELQAETLEPRNNINNNNNNNNSCVGDNTSMCDLRKQGSHVQAGEEKSTTNLFVGNLPTHVTEDMLGGLFQQFGDLYSIKIMWPRASGIARNHHSGFACFLRRVDAEAAMRALQDTDPFDCRQRLSLQWGKSIIPATATSIHADVNTDASHNSGEMQTRGEKGHKQEQQQQQPPPPLLTSHRTDGRAQLNARDLAEAHRLFRLELSLSRQSILQAMVFCFDRTDKAHHVMSLLQNLFLEATTITTPSASASSSVSPLLDASTTDTATTKTSLPKTTISVETLISRLYLVSDILFNSQQIGVRHAFVYRSVIESIAPTIFASMGIFSRLLSTSSRLRQRLKAQSDVTLLETAVHVVLQAWSTWNAYTPSFLQELQVRFETGNDGNDLNDLGGIRKRPSDALSADSDDEEKDDFDNDNEKGSQVAGSDSRFLRDPEDGANQRTTIGGTANHATFAPDATTAAAEKTLIIRQAVQGQWKSVEIIAEVEEEDEKMEAERNRLSRLDAVTSDRLDDVHNHSITCSTIDEDDDGEPLDDDEEEEKEKSELPVTDVDPLEEEDHDGEPLEAEDQERDSEQ